MTNTNHYLARIQVRRWINSTDISSGGGIWSFSFHTKPLQVLYNNTALSYVDNDTTPSTNEWSYVDGVVYMDDQSSTSKVAIVWPLHVTHTQTQINYSDPTDNTTDLAKFTANMLNIPNIRYTTSDQMFGVVSSDSTFMILGGETGWVSSLLTTRDTLQNQTVEVWKSTNGTASFIYGGTVSSYTYSNNDIINISVASKFDLFNKPCTMGDTLLETLLTSEQPETTAVYDQDQQIPITHAMAWSTPRDDGSYYIYNSGGTGYYYFGLDVSNLFQARCIDYTPNQSTSTNRTWSICKAHTDFELDTYIMGTMQDITIPGISDMSTVAYLTVNYSSAGTFTTNTGDIGDCVRVSYSGNYYAVIAEKDSVAYTVRLEFDFDNSAAPWGPTGTPSTVATSTFDPRGTGIKQLTPILEQNGKRWVLKHVRDFSISSASLTSSTHYYITLTNNCEGNFTTTYLGTPEPITPENSRIFVCVEFNFANALIENYVGVEWVIESTGLTYSNTGTTTHSIISEYTNLYIPRPGNTTLPSVGEVLLELTRPLIGFIHPSDLNTMKYRILHEDGLPVSELNYTYIYDHDLVGEMKVFYDDTYLTRSVVMNNRFTWSTKYQSYTEQSKSIQLGSIGQDRYLSHGNVTISSGAGTRFLEAFEAPVGFFTFSSPKVLALGDAINLSEITLMANINWRGFVVDIQYGLEISKYTVILLKEV